MAAPKPPGPPNTTTRGARPAEVYGFVGWVTTVVGYVLYLAWAYLPSTALHNLGFTYYPSKYWALALPAWLSVFVVFFYWVYASLNAMSVMPMESYSSVHDNCSRASSRGTEHALRGGVRPDGSIPPLVDLPLTTVNQILYGPGGAWEAGRGGGVSTSDKGGAGGRRAAGSPRGRKGGEEGAEEGRAGRQIARGSPRGGGAVEDERGGRYMLRLRRK